MRVRSLLLIAAGGILGAYGATVAQRAEGKPPPGSRDTPSLATLETRLARLESKAQTNLPPSVTSVYVTSTAAAPLPAPEPQVPASREEVQKKVAEEQESVRLEHANQHADPTWAPKANSAFRGDLGGIGKTAGFEVLSVDCRTSLCAARLRWSSFDAATVSAKQIAHAHYGINCGRMVTLDTPADGAKAYESSIMFDCATARWEK